LRIETQAQFITELDGVDVNQVEAELALKAGWSRFIGS